MDLPGIRKAAEEFLSRNEGVTHPEAYLLEVTPSGNLVSGCRRRDGRVKNIIALETAAAVLVDYEQAYSGWITLLQDVDRKWIVINAVCSTSSDRVTPKDLHDVTAACWDGYRASNRACDDEGMSRVFHHLSRLTYKGDSSIAIISQPDFLEMVRDRYKTSAHAPYARLQNEAGIAERDSLLGVTFAASDLAMVTLQIGHPPYLWTDLLTCAKLANEKWWIVAKSSCQESFMA